MPATIEQVRNVGRAAAPAIQDNRFLALLGEEQWETLAPAVQRRFSKYVAGGETVIYVGKVTQLRKNRAGRALAQLLRLIGAPLPVSNDVNVPSIVSVTEDVATGGQIWTRLYANRTCFPQVIHSSKRFSGPTGLEEYIGFGVSMSLTVHADEGALVFKSAGYRIRLGRLTIPIPGVLHPGQLTVRHRDVDGESFQFSMTLHHTVLVELIHQCGLYREERQ